MWPRAIVNTRLPAVVSIGCMRTVHHLNWRWFPLVKSFVLNVFCKWFIPLYHWISSYVVFYLSHVCTCATRGRVIGLSVCQWTQKWALERIRNACNFFLQHISYKWKNYTLFTTRIVRRVVKSEFFCSLSKLSNKTIPQFQYFLLLFTVALLFQKKYSPDSAFLPQTAQSTYMG